MNWKWMLTSFLIVCSSVVVSARAVATTLCQGTEKTMLACTSEDKVVSLCASAELDGTRGHIQYRLARNGKVEFEYPKDKKHPKGLFTYEMDSRAENLKFKNGDYGYRIAQEHLGGICVNVTLNDEPSGQFECEPTASHVDEGVSAAAKAAGIFADAAGNPAGTTVPKGAAGTLCLGSEKTVISCFHRERIFSICASPDLDLTKGYVQYRASRSGKVEFEFPKAKLHPKGVFEHKMYPRSEALSFKNGAHEFTVVSEVTGHMTVIVSKEGKEVSSIPCAETDATAAGGMLSMAKAAGIFKGL